ncbi:6-phospho-beta-galactosidase [Lactobacillus sp. ESL0236]|uniref:6-phospho-beta-galactosidase n=1 Tax=unclassified Lactobacillus TaxID=2620435 RepID=UPI000EFD4720|nr:MULTISPECIES: 6-phospho-beta-galactosidase [unclassified Lactobacillus]RMC41278.1 6-phospho-beta-galactosidase [Lactobacillus sp. ESL0237]RMC45147.1 6-phospho-beta-galactosidase [Lactobacillus sp. ESL0234]RMC45979.1 6-phospho-beta-galactosidase [Lactobacillus sp. ESL0236]
MSLLNRVQKLPNDFVWGGATAAYQVEGSTKVDGKGETMWDAYLRKQGRFSPDPASDFYNRYPEDIRLAKKYGLNAIRVSIAWTRIFPQGYGSVNQKGVDFYHNLFKECLDNGIEPYVSLHHFDSPKNLFEDGDWLNRKNIDYFVDYAKFCFNEFKEVKNWFTINELISLAYSQYIAGTFPPNHHFDVTSAIQAEHNELLAHARVVNLYKSMNLSGRIGLIHVLQPVYPISDSEEDKNAAKLEDAFLNKFLLDGTFLGYYSKDTMTSINEILRLNNAHLDIQDGDLDILAKAATQNDIFGLNYYQNQFIKAYQGESENHFNGTGAKGTSSFKFKGVGEIVKKQGVSTTDWDWNIFPKGLYDVLLRVNHDYPNCQTIYITENGLGYKDQFDGTDKIIDDQPRIDFIDQHMDALLKAKNKGVNVQGYFVWSLQDQFSWANGYNKRYGLFYVDFKTQKRYIKKSALWFKELADTMK